MHPRVTLVGPIWTTKSLQGTKHGGLLDSKDSNLGEEVLASC